MQVNVNRQLTPLMLVNRKQSVTVNEFLLTDVSDPKPKIKLNPVINHKIPKNVKKIIIEKSKIHF